MICHAICKEVANRITAGIILASLILGAALLMRIQTSLQVVSIFFLDEEISISCARETPNGEPQRGSIM